MSLLKHLKATENIFKTIVLQHNVFWWLLENNKSVSKPEVHNDIKQTSHLTVKQCAFGWIYFSVVFFFRFAGFLPGVSTLWFGVLHQQKSGQVWIHSHWRDSGDGEASGASKSSQELMGEEQHFTQQYRQFVEMWHVRQHLLPLISVGYVH